MCTRIRAMALKWQSIFNLQANLVIKIQLSVSLTFI